MKISCVVVSYNRVDLLKKVIGSLLNQTYPVDEIIVIDNNSGKDTRVYLDRISSSIDIVKYAQLYKNTGGAGGFYHGIKEAYNSGADWIWVFDDDAVPKKTALDKLVNSDVFNFFMHGDPGCPLGFLASRVEWIDGSICHMNTPRVHQNWSEMQDLLPENIKLFSSSFVSTLINREAVKKVGYPVKEFFIWYDDTEYTSRITNHMPGFFVPQSRVIHHTSLNMRPLDSAYLNSKSIWKYQYGIRNETSVLFCQHGFLRALSFVLSRCLRMAFARINPILVGRLFLAGINGMFLNYKRYIEFPEE
jgi:GT2 family glycosyltransferase